MIIVTSSVSEAELAPQTNHNPLDSLVFYSDYSQCGCSAAISCMEYGSKAHMEPN